MKKLLGVIGVIWVMGAARVSAQEITPGALGPLSPVNFIQYGIRQAVAQGVPVNTIVLLLLFPLVATVIAAARHFVGLRGFGIFTPAVVSVAFLATGLQLGLTLFFGILLIAVLGRIIIRRVRLQYLPQMAMLILVMSLGIIGGIWVIGEIGEAGGWLGLDRILTVGIFPILLLVLLTETFISAQISHGVKMAATMTVETLVLATIGFFLMSLPQIQAWALIHPELTIISTGAANMLLGRFTGLRLMEYWRFRQLLRK